MARAVTNTQATGVAGRKPCWNSSTWRRSDCGTKPGWCPMRLWWRSSVGSCGRAAFLWPGAAAKSRRHLSLLGDLRTCAFEDRQQFLLLLGWHAERVERRLQRPDAGVELR